MNSRLKSRQKHRGRVVRTPQPQRRHSHSLKAVLHLLPICLEIFLVLSGPRGPLDWQNKTTETAISAPIPARAAETLGQ